jgi:HlyD family secretion protein
MTNTKRKSRRRWVAVVLLLIVAGLGGAGFLYFKKRDTLLTVQTEKVARRNITELVVANGRIQPVIQVVINPEVSGEITELPVKEGQRVHKGELLVKIKPDNYIASRNSARASYNSALAAKTLALANLRKAKLEHQRAINLARTKLISESELLDAETSFEVMKASLETSVHQAEQAAAALAKAEDDLAKTTINAPMSGTVTKLRSQRGERVVGTALMAGTEIMTIADLDEMEARVDIGEVDVVLISVGQIARLDVEAFRDRKFTGRVTEIANSSKSAGAAGSGSSSSMGSQGAQEATKFEVKIRIEEKEVFRPGMSVTAEIETRYRSNVLAVPIQSVTTRAPKKAAEKPPGAALVSKANATSPPPAAGPGAEKTDKPIEVVFTLSGDQVRMVPVKRGISDDTYVEITEGLDEGGEVISGGYKAINRELEDGRKVKVGPPEEKPDEEKKS